MESLLTKTMLITESRNAKTLTPSHLKQCIQSESRFDFLKDLVRNIPDASVQEDNENNAEFVESTQTDTFPAPCQPVIQPTFSTNPATPAPSVIARTPVIQYQPSFKAPSSDVSDVSKVSVSVAPLTQNDEPKIHLEIGHPVGPDTAPSINVDPPPLVPISASNYSNSSTGDNLFIDEDYDN